MSDDQHQPWPRREAGGGPSRDHAQAAHPGQSKRRL